MDNPWVSRASVLPENGMPRAFDVSRVRLDCILGNDGLYFGHTRLEPNRLIGFQAGGTAITGGILSLTQPQPSAMVRVMVETFPVQLEKLLSAGIDVTDGRSRQKAGTLRRVVNSDRLDTPDNMLLSSQPDFGKDFKRMIFDLELVCTISGGVPFALGQQIDYGRTLNFALLGQQMSGVIRYDEKLPPLGVLSHETVQVEFRNVPPELVAWIRVGEQEYSLNGLSTWKIERIVSNQPAKLALPVPDPSHGLAIEHPVHRDIRCLVALDVFLSGNDMFYVGNLLKVGSAIRFDAKKWSLTATLVSF